MSGYLFSKKAFTLVELLIVIAIIGILVTIVIIAINPIRVLKDTNDTKKRTELNQIKTSLQLYFNDNNRYPTPDPDPALSEFGTGGTTPLSPTYMKQDPTALGYTVIYAASGTEYAAGVVLANPSTDDNDSGSATKCASSITAASLTTSGEDYFICPD